jgi:hypothetical protein
MAEKIYKCTGECGKEFKFGAWECFPGVKHTVEAKTYYLNDAPHCDPKLDPDGLSLRASRSHVHVIPEKKFKDENGNLVIQATPPVLFVQGQYSTTDPEQQYFIERAKIDVGYDRWFAAYHTPTQKQRIKDNQLREREVEIDTKLAEANSILAQAKAQASPKRATT